MRTCILKRVGDRDPSMDREIVEEIWMHITKGKKTIWKDSMLYLIHSLPVWNEKGRREWKNHIAWTSRVGHEQSTRFGVIENAPYNTMKGDVCHYIFVKIHRMYNSKNELRSFAGWWCVPVGWSFVTNALKPLFILKIDMNWKSSWK